jgi:hypothetical protein
MYKEVYQNFLLCPHRHVWQLIYPNQENTMKPKHRIDLWLMSRLCWSSFKKDYPKNDWPLSLEFHKTMVTNLPYDMVQSHAINLQNPAPISLKEVFGVKVALASLNKDYFYIKDAAKRGGWQHLQEVFSDPDLAKPWLNYHNITTEDMIWHYWNFTPSEIAKIHQGKLNVGIAMLAHPGIFVRTLDLFPPPNH